MHAPISRQHLHMEPLYEDAYAVVAGAQSSWVRRRRVELADLMNEPWALPPPDSAVGSIFVEAFLARGSTIPGMAVEPQPPARAALAATGQFLSIVPSSALKLSTGHPALKALPVELPTTRRPTGILRFKNIQFQSRGAAFHRLCPRRGEAASQAADGAPLIQSRLDGSASIVAVACLLM